VRGWRQTQILEWAAIEEIEKMRVKTDQDSIPFTRSNKIKGFLTTLRFWQQFGNSFNPICSALPSSLATFV
jgi:hypothetical protein